jgi:hypothetical protein
MPLVMRAELRLVKNALDDREVVREELQEREREREREIRVWASVRESVCVRESQRERERLGQS